VAPGFTPAPATSDVLILTRRTVGPPAAALGPLLILALVAHASLVMLELFGRHAAIDAARVARLLTRGGLASRLWGGVLIGGVLVPIALLVASAVWQVAALNVAGAGLALAALWLWEDLWVRAGQSIPLS
jgi:hypothetical protein